MERVARGRHEVEDEADGVADGHRHGRVEPADEQPVDGILQRRCQHAHYAEAYHFAKFLSVYHIFLFFIWMGFNGFSARTNFSLIRG
jgi:hypothetical protein